MCASFAGEFDGSHRFQVQGRLGAGGYGVVYRVLDRERNVPVALKTLKNLAAKALVRFKQEFRALADVSHPNLVTLYELSSLDDQWFFTMELVDGVNFLWYVRGEAYPAESEPTSAVSEPTGSDLRAFFDQPEAAQAAAPPPTGRADLERLRHALPQLVEGVLALHAAGKLHRDIKPSNVMVTREGRVVVLDFGLVAEIAPAHSHTVDAVGTPAYMSPEQVAGSPLTEASDWYNVGALLFQSLTGQLPFTGPPAEVMRRKQECDPPAPRTFAPDVPADLDALCQQLLRRDPHRRPRGSDILAAVRGASLPVASADTPAGSGLVFVGRGDHLSALAEAYRTMRAGRAITVAVHGGSGMGKTALVREFLEPLRGDPEVVVLAGRCYERESVPYKALDAVIDALTRYLRKLPPAEAEGLLPHDILALARVFPVLRQVGAVNRARRAVLDIPDSTELRRRAFAALRELLIRLADRRALVLFIDDLQWADLDSAALLEDLLKPPDPPLLMLIGCYRSEEADTSPFLRTILPKRRAESNVLLRDIPVAELSAAESRELALALAVGEPARRERHAEAVARESGGNPFIIEELARFGAVLSRDVRFESVIEGRLAHVSPGARRLLNVVAVAGRPVEVGVACRAADLDTAGETVLVALRAAHLVRTRQAAGQQDVEPYHDRIREVVVAQLPPDALTECHLRLAAALVGSGRADPETLARHYLAAGDADSAAEYASSAAAKAAQALAFDRAAGLYRFALQLGGTRIADRLPLEIALADALANAGRGAEAAQAYLSASMSSGPVLGVELHRRAAQQFYVSGHIEDGGRVLRGVLRQVGMTMPDSARAALWSLLWRRVQIRLRGLRFVERHETQIAGQDLLRIDTCWAVGVGMGTFDMLRGADFQARHLLLALRAGEPYRVARALAMEAAYVAMRGTRSRRRTQRLLHASQQLAERAGQPYARGLATLTTGIAAWLDGRWRESHGLVERAEQIFRERCTGVDWEILIAELFGLASRYFLGEIAELSRRLPLLLEEAEARGSLMRATCLRIGFFSHVAWLAGDAPERARQEIETGIGNWRHGRFDYLSLWARGARADIALYRGDLPPAERRLDAPGRSFARALDRFVQAGFVLGLDSRARRRLAVAAAANGPRDRAASLRAVESHARAILRQRTGWGDALAHLLRAGAAATRGAHARAFAALDLAERGFVGSEMALHAAVARRCRGALIGGEAGRAVVAAADAWMAGQGIVRPDRITAMLAPGRWS